MKAKFVLMASAGLLACTPAGALNKCVATDGKVTYQQQQCAAVERAAVVPLPPTQAELDRRALEKATREAAERLSAESAQQASNK